MSPAHRFLHADNGGAGFTLPAPVKMHPSEIALTLSADVLRLPYTPAIRLVLAEIVSLHAVNGCCDATDPHFAARLSINKDTASEAVKKLVADGLLVRVTTPTASGSYRTLTPNPAAIAAKAATNAYPESASNPRRNFRLGTESRAGNSGAGEVAAPEIPATRTGNSGDPHRNFPQAAPEIPESRAGNSGANIPDNNTGNTNNLTDDAAFAAALGSEKKIGADFSSHALPAEVAVSAPQVAPAPPAKAKLQLLRDSALATLPAFAAAWQAAAEANPDTYEPFVGADLKHYHTALLDWSNADGKKKYDWLATIRNSMRRDADKGGLRRLGTKAGAPSQVETRQTVIEETLAARRARRAQLS